MSDNVIPLFGLECAECTRPAKSHDFHTGMTIHLSPRAQVDLMSRALQATAYIDRDKLMAAAQASPSAASTKESP